MAVAEKTTYISIPPPPLPEFYLTGQEHGDTESRSRAVTEVESTAIVTKEPATWGDGAYDGRPRTVSMPQTSSRPLMLIPPPFAVNDVPPLAIYHICRICLRPRSARYHREHPIPVDGLPPPPGICRRCRVTSVEETKRVPELVIKSESNPIKIGCITPFIPDRDIVSNEEMRSMKLEKYLNDRSSDRRTHYSRSESPEDIVYRHVRVVDESSDVTPTGKKVYFTSQDAIENFNSEPSPEPPQAPYPAATSMQVQPTENPPMAKARLMKATVVRELGNPIASVTTHASSQSGPASTIRASTKVTTRFPPERTDAEIRQVAREEAERYANAIYSPGMTESHTRTIAREEIERYRQAERKLEAHPEPFAHGRLVPVERRIAVERDIEETKAWEQPKEKGAPSVQSSAKPASQATRLSVAAFSTRTEDTRGKASSKPDSRGPKLRRDLTNEDHSGTNDAASAQSPKSFRASVKEVSQVESAKSKPEIEQQRSVKAQEVYDAVPESDPPRRSLRAELYVGRMSRKPQSNKDNIIEVVEEVDLPPSSRTASYRRATSDHRPESPISGRVREIEIDLSRQGLRDRTPNPPNPIAEDRKSTWARSSKPPINEYWYGEGTVRTGDSQSTRRRGEFANVAKQQEARDETWTPGLEKYTTSSARDRTTEKASQISDKTYWPIEQHEPKKKTNRQPTDKDRQSYSGRPINIDRFVKRTDTLTELSSRKGPARSVQSMRGGGSEYIYTERTVTPVNRPRGWRPSDEGPSDERVEYEEFLETRVPVGEARPGERRTDRHEERRRGRREERRRSEEDPSAKPFEQDELLETRRPVDPTRLENRDLDCQNDLRRERRGLRQDLVDLNREVGRAKERVRERVPALAHDVVDEIKQVDDRRREHKRERKQQQADMRDSEESNHVRFNKKVDISPTPPGSDASSSAFHSFHSFGRGNGRQIDGQVDSNQGEHAFAEDERRGRMRSRVSRNESSYARASLREGWKTEDKYDSNANRWVAGGRPLERALSESPSREDRISEDRQGTLDSRGPYRVQERPTDSMRAQDGSPDDMSLHVHGSLTSGRRADAGQVREERNRRW